MKEKKLILILKILKKIADACNYNVVFVNKKDNSKVLSSKNINRKEI